MFRIYSLMAILLLSACASDPIALSKNAEEDYKKGQLYMENENYPSAVLFLEKFSVKYPYSQYATDVELMRLKASYLDNQFVLSETLGLRFIDAHPDHKDRVYAQYLVAMSYYKQSSSSRLDQQFSHRSRDAFLELKQQFPNNAYNDEINKYLKILTNRVAEHEMLVGEHYYEQELYVASLNRFLVVKNDYSDSTAAEESLYYLAATYMALSQKSLAQEAISMMQTKYPRSPWREKAEKLL